MTTSTTTPTAREHSCLQCYYLGESFFSLHIATVYGLFITAMNVHGNVELASPFHNQIEVSKFGKSGRALSGPEHRHSKLSTSIVIVANQVTTATIKAK